MFLIAFFFLENGIGWGFLVFIWLVFCNFLFGISCSGFNLECFCYCVMIFQQDFGLNFGRKVEILIEVFVV